MSTSESDIVDDHISFDNEFMNSDDIFENSVSEETIFISDEEDILEDEETRRKVSKKSPDVSVSSGETIIIEDYGETPKKKQNEEFPRPSTSKEEINNGNSETVTNSIMIRGVTIELPVKPYRSQVAVMSSVLQSIQKNQNSLLESPTGTGKTLALLCAALAWQKQEIENRKLSNVIPLWSAQEENDEFTDSHAELQTCCTENIEHPSKKAKLNVDAGTPKKSTSNFSSSKDSPQKSPVKYTPMPKIYFCSRTHSQLQQAVKELKKTKYSKNIAMTTLSSRKQSCVQDLNKNFGSKDEMCQKTVNKQKVVQGKPQSGCVYYDNVGMMMNMCRTQLSNEAWDMEDLFKMGKDHNGCPFYTSRKLLKPAQIVFCPYNYIVSPTIRTSLEMGTDDIVIIDEAHNIEDCCRESVSINFTFQNIIDGKNDIDQLYNDCRETHHGYLSKYFNKWFDWFINHNNITKGDNEEGTFVMNGEEFYQSLERHELGPQHTTLLEKSITSVSENIKILLKDHKNLFKKEISEKTFTLIKSICTIFSIFYLNCKDYNIVILRKPKLEQKSNSSVAKSSNTALGGWLSKTSHKQTSSFELYLSVNCLNPALAFKPVAENSKCIILASGTLAPITSFSSELGVDFPISLQLSHNISNSQLWMSSISYGPGNIHLESTFANTKKLEWQDSLGNLIIWVCKTVPRGILCFLPSYSLLKILFQRWNENGMMRSITSHKNIFSEVNNMEEHNIMMTDYYDSCIEEKGAILFAVYRGKVSEGMDFKDDQARAVITVGIPYPNIKDEVVKAKMKFNDITKNGLSSGSDWLRIQAFRALNQALGRCIRHKDDWGAVIMVDSRFTKPFFFNSISKWAQQYMRFYETWQSFSTSDQNLVSFINDKF